MSSSHTRYYREYKLGVVRRVPESGRTQREVAKELGIAANALSRRVRQYSSEKAEAFAGKGTEQPCRPDRPPASRERTPAHPG